MDSSPLINEPVCNCYYSASGSQMVAQMYLSGPVIASLK